MQPEQSSEAARMVGAVLSRRYRLTRLLGEGGMGAVFAATGLADGQGYAVKLLHPEFVQNPDIVGRFFAEAQTVQRLQHPSIVRVFEAGKAEDGTPFIAMELLEGRSLTEALQQSGALPLSFAAKLFIGALEALAYAHAQGIIHRDLKPDNLFVIPGMDPRLKLVDFGIAKVMDHAGGMGSRTRTGMLLGTPAYMSPEQLKDSKAVDARSDLWSMTVIFYEMLSGKDAFPSDNPMEQMTMVLMGQLPDVAALGPQAASLGPFFARGLARDPAARFHSAAEMVQALLPYAHGAGAYGPPPSPPQPGPTGPQPWKPPASIASTQPSTPNPLLTPSPRQAIDPSQVQVVTPTPLSPTPTPRPRRPAWIIPLVVIAVLFLGVGVAVGVWVLGGR